MGVGECGAGVREGHGEIADGDRLGRCRLEQGQFQSPGRGAGCRGRCGRVGQNAEAQAQGAGHQFATSHIVLQRLLGSGPHPSGRGACDGGEALGRIRLSE